MIVRLSRQDIDEEILDSAAGLIAQRGSKQTSVQAVADAVGYSKAGLLHRFPSKEELLTAVIAHCKAQSEALLASASAVAPGPERDYRVITVMAEQAQRRPGFISLMLSSVAAYEGFDLGDALSPVADDLLQSFAVVKGVTDTARVIAVAGAMGALAVATLGLRASHPDGLDAQLVALVVKTSVNALGHSPEAIPALAPATTSAPKDNQ